MRRLQWQQYSYTALAFALVGLTELLSMLILQSESKEIIISFTILNPHSKVPSPKPNLSLTSPVSTSSTYVSPSPYNLAMMGR